MANFDIIVKAVDQTRGTLQSVEQGLAKVERRAQLVNNAIKSINSVANVAAVALAALTAKAVGYAGAINDASENTGIAVQSILALGNALTTNGGEASKAADAVNKFTDAVGTANSGSKELRESFAQVGISLQDLKTLDDTALFEKTLVGLAGIEEATKRNNIQADIFGKTLKGANIAGFGKDIQALTRAQRDNAAAIKAAGVASDALKNAFNTIQVAAVKGLKPIADAINGLGQEKINKVADAFLQIAVALTALAGAAKVLSVVTAVAGAFGAAWLTATVGVAKLSLAVTSFNRTITFANGYVKSFVAGTSKVTTVSGLLLNLLKRIPYAIAAVGLALTGLVRFIPVVGLIVTALYAVNEAVKFAFNINPLDFFITKAKEAYEFIKRITGFGKQVQTTAADFQRTDKDTTPVPLPSAAGNANREQKDISFLGQLRENYAKVREEYNQLLGALSKTTDLNFASKIFDELSSRAAQLGIVLEKDAALIQRDYALAVKTATEELRQQEIQLANDAVTTQRFKNELQSTNLEIYEQSLRLQNAALTSKKFQQEIAQTNLSLMENRMRLADAKLQTDIFVQELQASAQALQQQELRLGMSALMVTKFEQELKGSSLALQEQENRLGMSAQMAQKFAQELKGSSLALQESALKLADAGYQQELFNQSITGNRQNLEQQTVTLRLLNTAFDEGKISLAEYSALLGQIDDSLINSTALIRRATQTANTNIRSQDRSTDAAKKLTSQLRSGAITWRQYGEAVKTLDSDGVAKSFINVTREIERAKSMAEVFAETLDVSVRSAGDTLAKSLTDGIVKGKLSLNSFKDFFGSILNDIAAMIVQKQFVSPIVDALTGAMSGGGSGGNILSSIASAAGKGSGFSLGGVSDFFSSSWSGISDWFGGFFADGGYLPSGKVGIAGEAGPELISGPANIVPMDKLGGGNQPTPIVNFTINAIDTQTGVEFLLKNKPQIIGMVQQGFNSQGKSGIYR